MKNAPELQEKSLKKMQKRLDPPIRLCYTNSTCRQTGAFLCAFFPFCSVREATKHRA